MQKVQVHLWFNNDAREAVSQYVSLFPGSAIDRQSLIRDTPSGDADIYEFRLAGFAFQAINGGPAFKNNGSILLTVEGGDEQEIRRIREALAEGGEVFHSNQTHAHGKSVELKDRWGVYWQFIPAGKPGIRIVPTLLFSGSVMGKAEEALDFYASLLPDSAVHKGDSNADASAETENAGQGIIRANLSGTAFNAENRQRSGERPFNEAVSIVVHCADQAEIDRLWGALSASPEHEACGWLKDRYGVSWQIVPELLYDLAINEKGVYDPGVAKALLHMKKLDIAKLEQARGT